jgi:tricorn protease
MTIRIVDVASGTTTTVDHNLYMFQGALDAFAPSWSADSRWLAYNKDTDRNSSAIALFDTRTGKSRQVTSGFYNDQTPVFDPDG